MPLAVFALMLVGAGAGLNAVLRLVSGDYATAIGLAMLAVASQIGMHHTRCPKCRRRPWEKELNEGFSTPGDLSDHYRHCGRYALYCWPFQYRLGKKSG